MDPQINLDGSIFHKPCAKCQDCNCQITISNFCKNESGDQTILLCKTHYFKRFHEGGSYLGGDKFAKTATRDANKTDASVIEGAVKSSAAVAASNASSSEEPARHVFKKMSVKEETPAAAPAPVAAAPTPVKAPEPEPEPQPEPEPEPVKEEPEAAAATSSTTDEPTTSESAEETTEAATAAAPSNEGEAEANTTDEY